jgi:hypothetical protein
MSPTRSSFQPAAAYVLAGRYHLLRAIGRGGHGEVWEARDALAGDVVAIKLLREGEAADPARARREISALRLLRLPGVVRLLDEGIEEGCPFLVMERVDGLPFPGHPTPCPWPAVASTVVAALETLARIHAAAIIHRDLKPENILVGPDGRPTILDFGLSSGRLDEEGRPAGLVTGSFAYLAPEQLRSEVTSPETDLYAVGVLLYEALTGRLPHVATDLRALVIARLTERPTPLALAAPSVPEEVCALVDQMLAIEPEDRPRSAAEALAILRGQPVLRAIALPRLGGDGPVRALCAFARASRPAWVIGEPGAGRTRCLAEAAEALEREGRMVLRLSSSPLPYESLLPVIGTPLGERLAEVEAGVHDRLRAALGQGVVLVVDDADRLERCAIDALRRACAHGAVLFASRDRFAWADAQATVELAPLDEADLRPLFAGDDRLLHLPTDAARVLFARTAGVAARVADEVEAWVRAGLSRWEGRSLITDRDALDRLETTFAPPAPPPRREPVPLPPHLAELVAWIELAAPDHDALELGPAMGKPRWYVEALVRDLLDLGVAHRRHERGTLELVPGLVPPLPTARQRAIHRALAALRAPGAEGRLLRLLRGAEGGAVDECVAVALEAEVYGRRVAQEGWLGRAVAAIREGLLFVRRRPDPCDARALAAEEALLALWTEIAIFEATPVALDRVLYELCRTHPRTARVVHLEGLVRAALTRVAGADRALSLAEAVPPFAEPRLERWRLGLCVRGIQRTAPERLPEVLAEAAAWAEASGESSARAALDEWRARHAYQQGRFEEAARLHVRAAEAEPFVVARVAALARAASAFMEAFRLEEAAAQAGEARALAAERRHAYYEARAEWLLRTILYRAGRAAEPDRELVEAVGHLGVPDLEALVCFNEAAVAFRGAERDLGRALAVRADRLWTGMKKRWPSLLARALSLACGRPADEGEIERIAEQAAGCPVPGLGVQMLGLLAMVSGGARAWSEAAARLSEGVPCAHLPLRMDVLSVGEALAALEEGQPFARSDFR